METLSDIGVFVRVVEQRSFTRAGQLLGLSASGVSRVISRLETRLGAQLLARSTRSVGLTADGVGYYESCLRILRELEDANGRLGRGPRAAARRCAERARALRLRDHRIDPIAEGIDVLVRVGDLRDSALVSKRLGTMRFAVVGSPDYLVRHGRPSEPADLASHQTLSFLAGSGVIPWRFRVGGRDLQMAPTGRLSTNSVDALREAARAGHGLARMVEASVKDDIAAGTLEVVLHRHEEPKAAIHVLFTRDNANAPNVRAFLALLGRIVSRRD